MRIGQAKNAWELDLKEGTWEKVNIEEIKETQGSIESEYFWDESIEQVTDASISITLNSTIQLHFQQKFLDLQALFLEKTSTEFISPEYLVEI
jgi:hypothetical protein